MKKCSAPLIIREMKNQNHKEISSQTSKNVYGKVLVTRTAGEDVQKK